MRSMGFATIAVVLVVVWSGEAAAAKVELTRVGNDPQNVWCDTGARQLAQGATLNVQILGRGKKDAQITGKIRMKSQTDKFEWAGGGEPTVTFTRTGSSPTSFGVKAKRTAPVGTYSIAFAAAAVDDLDAESAPKSCTIEVIPGFTVALTVNPTTGATSATMVTLRPVESGAPPPIKSCQYRVIPQNGGIEQHTDQWQAGCSGWGTRLAPGTYLLQVHYRYQMGPSEQELFTRAHFSNYVVAAVPEGKVKLDKAGNDPAENGWCDKNAKQLAQGSTMNVSIKGRTITPGMTPLEGRIRIKSAVPFQWVSGPPLVTFRGDGITPTSFGITASSSASFGTYSIVFVAVDDAKMESAPKACKIEVVPRTLALPDTSLKRLGGTFSLKLLVSPGSGVATSDTPLTLRLLKEGTWNPPRKECKFAAIPTSGGRAWSHGPDLTCALPSPTLVAGTYTVRLSYRYEKPDGSWGEGTSEFPAYVVNPSVSPGPIVPPTPLLLQVAWVEASSLVSVAEARITVCNVDVDAAYSLYGKGRRGSSEWEEIAGSWAEFPQGWDLQSSWGSPCPINQSRSGRLVIKLQLSLRDCCSTITYQVVATNRRRGGGKSYSNLKALDLPNFWPCPAVPVCVPADGTYDNPQNP